MVDAIRYYFDQHMPWGITHGLCSRGIDVLTAQDAGRCGLDDAEQLHFATTETRVMVTHDADFLVLAATGISHAGIAYCHPDKYSIGEMIQMLELLHGVLSQDDMKDQVEYL